VNNYLGVNESILLFEATGATRDILNELHITEYSYPIRGIFLSRSPVDVLIVEHYV